MERRTKRTKKTLQRKGTKRKMQQWERNHSSKQCRKGILTHHKRKSQKRGLHNRRTRRRHPWKRYCRPPSGPKRSSQPNTEEKNSIHDILDVQKASDKAWLDAILYAPYRNGVGKKSRNNQKTEHGTHSTNPNQIWAHKKNNYKRQHTARRSAISHRICNPNGWNDQRDQQKWHGTRTEKWWKT